MKTEEYYCCYACGAPIKEGEGWFIREYKPDLHRNCVEQMSLFERAFLQYMFGTDEIDKRSIVESLDEIADVVRQAFIHFAGHDHWERCKKCGP